MKTYSLDLSLYEIDIILRSLMGEDILDDSSCVPANDLFDLLCKLHVYRDNLKTLQEVLH